MPSDDISEKNRAGVLLLRTAIDRSSTAGMRWTQHSFTPEAVATSTVVLASTNMTFLKCVITDTEPSN